MPTGKHRGISPEYQQNHRQSFKFLVLIVFLLAANGLFAQLTATFDSPKDFLEISNDKHTTTFILTATPDEIADLSARAASMPETLTFTIDTLQNHAFRCVILFTHPTETAYVKKTLIFMGITHIMLNEKLYTIGEFNPED